MTITWGSFQVFGIVGDYAGAAIIKTAFQNKNNNSKIAGSIFLKRSASYTVGNKPLNLLATCTCPIQIMW